MDISQIIKKDKLLKLPLFSELDSNQVIQITSISSINNYKKNDIIFKEGSKYLGFFIVLKGTIKVYKNNPQGKEVTIHLIKPFNAFADIPLFEGKTYPVNAQAAENCVLLFIPADGFKKLLFNNSVICFKMLSGFAKRMRTLTKKIEDLSLKDVSNRLAGFIVDEALRSGTDKYPEPFITLTISKKTLASYLGTITETLSRTFCKLETEDLIRVRGKKIFIENFDGLKQLAK
jgi:CRP-like cAMP-binding protein